MRTEWQSSTAVGNAAARNLKGNRHSGDGWCFRGENLLDLSRSIYLGSCHPYIFEVLILVKNNNKRSTWVRNTLLGTFFLSLFFNTVSQTLIQGMALLGSTMVLLVIIAIGVVFDVIGVASTAADLPPLNARAAKRVPGAKLALILASNSDRVSSFCSDVVGDICGIISGSAAAAILFSLALNSASQQNVANIAIVSVVASLTVGGKAAAKSLAIKNSTDILLGAGRVIYFFQSLLPWRKGHKKGK